MTESPAEFTAHIRGLAKLFTLEKAIDLHMQADESLRLRPTREKVEGVLARDDINDERRKLLLVQTAVVAFKDRQRKRHAIAYLQLPSDAVEITTPEPEPPGALVPVTQAGAETKAERFRRLAPPRVSRALKAIALVANLGDRSNYELTIIEAQTIIETLRQDMDACSARLLSGRKPARSFDFKL